MTKKITKKELNEMIVESSKEVINNFLNEGEYSASAAKRDLNLMGSYITGLVMRDLGRVATKDEAGQAYMSFTSHFWKKLESLDKRY